MFAVEGYYLLSGKRFQAQKLMIASNCWEQ